MRRPWTSVSSTRCGSRSLRSARAVSIKRNGSSAPHREPRSRSAPTSRSSTSARTITLGSRTIRVSLRRARRPRPLGLRMPRSLICGTQDIHRSSRIGSPSSRDRGHDPLRVLLDANGGLFETVLGEEDAVISDALNHAAHRRRPPVEGEAFRYANNDMADLERQLKDACPAFKLHREDGVSRWRDRRGHWGRSATSRRSTGLVMVDDCMPWLHGRAQEAARMKRAASSGGRCHHRQVGQGARWRIGRIHERAERDRGAAASAEPPVPVLEHARAGDRRDVDRRARPHRVGC